MQSSASQTGADAVQQPASIEADAMVDQVSFSAAIALMAASRLPECRHFQGCMSICR